MISGTRIGVPVGVNAIADRCRRYLALFFGSALEGGVRTLEIAYDGVALKTTQLADHLLIRCIFLPIATSIVAAIVATAAASATTTSTLEATATTTGRSVCR